MGSTYASPEMVERVKNCIRELYPCTYVYPSLFKKLKRIDSDQAKGALRKIASKPNKPVDIGADSMLIRGYRGFGILRTEPADYWWYDPVGDERLPLFPILHEIIAERFPLIHSLLH